MRQTSYPFLAVARAHGVPYGRVLTYADFHQRCVSTPPDQRVSFKSYWEEEATLNLPEDAKVEIRVTWAVLCAQDQPLLRHEAAPGVK